MILICGLFEGKYFHVLFPHLKLCPVHHQNNSGMLEQKNTLMVGWQCKRGVFWAFVAAVQKDTETGLDLPFSPYKLRRRLIPLLGFHVTDSVKILI